MNLEVIKAPLWGAVGGAIVLAIVGFSSWGGWVTAGKASQLSADAAGFAVLARLTPICVFQYSEVADKIEKHAALMKTNSWERSGYVEKQGWSMIPGEKEVDSDVSRDCALALAELKG